MPFVSGLELNAGFYRDAVAPLLSGRAHAAALLGDGSDVLGYDTERSTDHGWGPRLQVFVAGPEIPAMREILDAGLPETYQGRPVRYGWDEVPVGIHVVVATIAAWVRTEIGRDPRDGMSTMDWLLAPQQRLLGVVRGAVYADPDGELGQVRGLLAWYPRGVWLWLLACQWTRIAQEEAFVGRSAEVGDDLGSAVVAARLVRDLMRLCLLLARRYAPYSKWLGSAFARLAAAPELAPLLRRALAAADYPSRERHLGDAYEVVARLQNRTRLATWVDPTRRPYRGRPYQVIRADRFAEALAATLTDPALRELPRVGSVDQWADSTDFLGRQDLVRGAVDELA